MEPHELLERVDSSETFLDFARALIADRARAVAQESLTPSSPHGADAGGWENTRIETFLEAAIAWAEGSAFGQKQGLARSNPWKQFAHFLYAGKIYE